MFLPDFYKTDDPIGEILTVDAVRNWTRIRVATDDAILGTLQKTAIEWGQKYTNRQFELRTFSGTFSGVNPPNKYCGYPFIQLRRAPLKEITKIEMDISGDITEITDYLIEDTSAFARVKFPNFTGLDLSAKVEVTFSAGYETVPDTIKTAILTHIAFLYENRGDAMAEGGVSICKEAKMLYRPYRILNTFG